jgi:hypothetical protein
MACEDLVGQVPVRGVDGCDLKVRRAVLGHAVFGGQDCRGGQAAVVNRSG